MFTIIIISRVISYNFILIWFNWFGFVYMSIFELLYLLNDWLVVDVVEIKFV